MSVSSWEPDPTGRHQYRWWDGEQWTDQVADDGIQSVDPVSASETNLSHEMVSPVSQPSSPMPGELGDQFTPDSPDPFLMLSSRGKRFGGFILEILLIPVTLIVGWLIWALIVYSRGQTPAKHVLGMRVVRIADQRAASFGLMALRELVLKIVPSMFLLGLLWDVINGIALLVDDRHQALWDKMLKTVVIDDPDDIFKPVPRPRHPLGG